MVRITPPCTPYRSTAVRANGGSSFKHPFTSFWSLCTKQAKKLAGSSARSPKKLLMTVSNKAMKFRRKKSSGDNDEDFSFGDEGLWQRTILMGDKCQPLDFSGVIYYDSQGNKLSEFPAKSPRASPLPRYAYMSPEK